MGMLEYMLASGERHLITDEEIAVIEAAKAVEHEAPIPLGAPPTVLFLDALAKLHVAVEALQEVEE